MTIDISKLTPEQQAQLRDINELQNLISRSCDQRNLGNCIGAMINLIFTMMGELLEENNEETLMRVAIGLDNLRNAAGEMVFRLQAKKPAPGAVSGNDTGTVH